VASYFLAAPVSTFTGTVNFLPFSEVNNAWLLSSFHTVTSGRQYDAPGLGVVIDNDIPTLGASDRNEREQQSSSGKHGLDFHGK
jgi:hypothetical protein